MFVCVHQGERDWGGEDTWLEYWQNDFLLTVVYFWHLCLHNKHTRTCTHAHTALLCFRLSVKVPVSHSVMRLYTFSACTHSCSSSHKQSQFNMLIWVTSLCHHSGHVWDFAWTNVPNYFYVNQLNWLVAAPQKVYSGAFYSDTFRSDIKNICQWHFASFLGGFMCKGISSRK